MLKPSGMRRIGGVLGILVVLGLALLLMWRVYVHRTDAGDTKGVPSVVQLEKFAMRSA